MIAVNTSGRETVFASEYCPPTIKLPRLISWNALRAFYDGGHYSLRGDIIHRGTVFTPTPCQACMEQCEVPSLVSLNKCWQLCCSGQGGAAGGAPGGGPEGQDYDNRSDDGNSPNDGNGFDDGNGSDDNNGSDDDNGSDDNNGPNDGNGFDDGNGSDDNNGSDDDNGSGSGAVVAGVTIFTTISALLVALASAMN